VTGTDTDTGVYYPAANQVALATNGTLALFVDANQNVGVGTTTPDIFSNSFARNLGIKVTGSGATCSINVSGGSGGAGRIQFGVETTRYGLIYVDATNFMEIATTTALPIKFVTNNVERIRIPSNASGITFPATQVASSDANTLDDYEEGTFTPTFSSQGGSITTVSGSGNYTKIGNTVFLWINLTITTVGTATGDCNIGSLPFSASQTGAGTGITSGNVVISVRQGSGTTALFANATNGGSAMANGTSYQLSINYFV
jgi:hypothetical protein